MVGFNPSSIEDLGKPLPILPKQLDDFFPLVIEDFMDFDSLDWGVENDPIQIPVEGENRGGSDGSDASRSVGVEDTLKGTGDGNPFVEAGVPVELGNPGNQIEEGMEKINLLGSLESSLESSVGVSINSENVPEFDEQGSGGCVAVVQNVSEKTVSGANGDIGLNVGLDIKLEKPEKVTFVGVSGTSARTSEPDGWDLRSLQIEEVIEKNSSVDASKSAVLVSLKSENITDSDEKGSDGSVAAVPTVTEGTVVVASGEQDSKVTSDTTLGKQEDGRSDKKGGELSDEDENDSSSESESEVSSSSSSSSSCSDSEEEEEEEEVDDDVREMEEGEIMDLEVDVIAGDSDAEEDGGAVKGPIISKNEVQILPPVPPVEVALEPHHQTLPVGVILSIMGTKVIVEGSEKHNPLNEGSILWITESRLPLGLVDEIFGPVESPYYVVRYNSDKEVPAGICQGTPVSFVDNFASFILKDNSLYKKGYDASGENDEEVFDELEFSDDEKEAEYKKMIKMAKQGSNGRKRGSKDFVDRKKAQQKGEFQKKIHPSVPPGLEPIPCGGRPPEIPNQRHTPSAAVPVGCGGFASSNGTGTGPGTASMSSFVPSVSQVGVGQGQGQGQSTYFMPQTNNGVWTNGMQFQQQQQQQQQLQLHQQLHQQQQQLLHQQQQQLLHQQHAVFPNGFPTNSLPPLQQNVPLPCGQPFQQPHSLFMNLPNGMPVQQQFNPSQMLLQNMLLPSGQSNFTTRPLSTPWTGVVGHPGFNQATYGMGFPNQLGNSSVNSSQQGVASIGACNEQNFGAQPPAVTQGNFAAPQQFNQGARSTRGRKPYRQGSGSFVRGRGRR